MILDSHGRPLRRVIGFIARYELATRALPVIGALSLVGFEVPLEEDEDEEGDAAPRLRMRRVTL